MSHPASISAAFADRSHQLFYGCTKHQNTTPSQQPLSRSSRLPPSRRTASRLLARPVQASSSAGRRARVLQQAADVEDTLRRLDQVAPLASFQLPRRVKHKSSHSSSESSSSNSSSSSESEVETAPAASRLTRRREMLQQLEGQASNIVARPAAAHFAPAAATVVKVCQGKKCSAGGSAALLQQFAAMPGVVAQPSKCLGKCRLCTVVKMASSGAGEVAYTNVNAANAAGVLAMHHKRLAVPLHTLQ